jgi:hypothetical protein
VTAPDAGQLFLDRSQLTLAMAMVHAAEACPDCAAVLGVALIRTGPGPEAYDMEPSQRHSVPCPTTRAGRPSGGAP